MPQRCAPRRLQVRGVVALEHDGEAFERGVGERPDQRVLPGHVDEVDLQHELAGLPLRVDATAGVRHEQGPHAESGHDRHRVGDLRGREPLVGMHAALHGHDLVTVQIADVESAGVAGSG